MSVAVTGAVRLRLYQGSDGQTRGNMEINADDVEFLSPRGETAQETKTDAQTGFEKVEPEGLPF